MNNTVTPRELHDLEDACRTGQPALIFMGEGETGGEFFERVANALGPGFSFSTRGDTSAVTGGYLVKVFVGHSVVIQSVLEDDGE